MFTQPLSPIAMRNPLSVEARLMLASLPSLRLRPSPQGDGPFAMFSDPPQPDQTDTPLQQDIANDAPSPPEPRHTDAEALQQINPYLKDNLATGKWLAFDINKGVNHIDINDKNNVVDIDSVISEQRLSTPISFKKKLAQPRFSRRRYLREYNGLRLLPVLLSCMGFVTILLAALVINFGILIPKTASNTQIAASKDALEQTILTLKPQLQALNEQHQALENTATRIKANIPVEDDIRRQIEAVLDDMAADRAIRLIHHDMTLTATPEDDIPVLALSLSLETGFITWMEKREELFQALVGVKVQQETLTAPPRQSTIIVETLMHIPVLPR